MAEIQAMLPNGSYRAVVAQREITLALPFSAKSGDSLELEVVVSQVPGVIEVNGINLFQVLPSGAYQLLTADASGSPELVLQSWQLPEVLEVTVIASPDGTQAEVPTTLTPPPETDTTVAVPVVTPTIC